MDERHPPPDAAGRARRWTARRSTRASTRASTRWSPPAPLEEVRAAHAAGASATARKALGFEELLAGDVDGDAAPHAQLRQAPADLDAQAGRRRAVDVTGRDAGRSPPRSSRRRLAVDRAVADALREVAGPGQRLPDRRARGAARSPLTPARVRRLCDRHLGHRRRRRARARAARRARLRRPPADLQPRRLGGRAVRQRRARGDPLPAPRRLDRRAPVLDPDRRGGDPPDDHRRRRPAASTWAARACLGQLPRRAADGTGEVGGLWRFQHVYDRQPAVRDPRRRPRRARGARPRPRSARRSSTTPLFPNRTNVSSGRELGAGRIRARIFERGVGETLSRGTGACGAAVAHVLRGGDSPRDRRARRRRARGRRRRGPARRPRRLGRAGLRRRAEPRARGRAAGRRRRG